MISYSKLCFLTVAVIVFGYFSPLSVQAASPSLLFSPSTIITKTNTQFSVSIQLDTASQSVGGAGVQLIFDPYYFSAISIQPGELFVDYPISSIDNERGLITISGISASPSDLFTGTGTFANIVFHPYHVGTSKVRFVFEPGSTKDSNIAIMADPGDILGAVNDLSVTIIEGSSTLADYPPPTTTHDSFFNLTQNPLVNELASSLGFSDLTSQFAAARLGRSATLNLPSDPLAPLSRQDPITDISHFQPPTPATAISTSSFLTLPLLILIILVILIVVGIILLIVLLRRRTPTPQFPSPPTPTAVNP